MPVPAQTILLVEDNEDDVFIFQRALKQAAIPHAVQIARDGQEALDYLFGEGEFADRTRFPLPFLVLLDLKLPLLNGLDVLAAIQPRPELARMCVVVLTSSAEARDLARAQELGAQAYFVKPPSAKILRDIIDSVCPPGTGKTDLRPKIPGDLFVRNEAGSA